MDSMNTVSNNPSNHLSNQVSQPTGNAPTSIKPTGAPWQTLLFTGLFLAAMVLRWALFPFVSGDYTAALSPWYDFIRSHGGFAAFKYSFATYNPPYLYLLALATFLPLSKMVAIKLVSVLGDLLLAYFAYLILRL